MYFEVNDNHEMIGLQQTKKLMEDIPNKIMNFMKLVLWAEFHQTSAKPAKKAESQK